MRPLADFDSEHESQRCNMPLTIPQALPKFSGKPSITSGTLVTFTGALNLACIHLNVSRYLQGK